MMKRLNWGPPERKQAKTEAIHALSHALGLLLMVDLKALNLTHPLHCEINMAQVENRATKGCDCEGPDEPEEHP